ncbi:MAG: addiction module protein [Bacteroidia bacterium]
MTKTVLKNKLVKTIGQVQDEKLLQGIYNFLNSHLHAENYELTDEDKAELDNRMSRHKAGLDKSYTWEEVKDRVRKRKKIN